MGRLDFARLPVFTGLTEVDLIKRYLAKNWRYRTNGIPTFGRVSAHLGSYAPDAAATALGFAGPAFGAEPGRLFNGFNLVEKVPADFGVHYRYQFEDPAGTSVHEELTDSNFHAANFADPTKEILVTFRNVWFSWAADWAMLDAPDDYTYTRDNNWLRASLGWPNYGLATMGGHIWDFAPLGGGAPLASIMTFGWDGSTVPRFQSILGDPTLCLFRVCPPATPQFTRNGSTVSLRWSPPVEPVLGYYVYRSTTGLNGFSTPLNAVPVMTPAFTDTTGAANLLYQVRAVKLQVTGSGSFYNLSQGIFITVP